MSRGVDLLCQRYTVTPQLLPQPRVVILLLEFSLRFETYLYSNSVVHEGWEVSRGVQRMDGLSARLDNRTLSIAPSVWAAPLRTAARCQPVDWCPRIDYRGDFFD
jgi:hypothetical protein